MVTFAATFALAGSSLVTVPLAWLSVQTPPSPTSKKRGSPGDLRRRHDAVRARVDLLHDACSGFVTQTPAGPAGADCRPLADGNASDDAKRAGG